MSPIHPENRARYPKDWAAISLRIRERAGWRCECEGECGLHRTNPGPRRCDEINGNKAAWANGKVVLTVAHLNHAPEDCRDENLKAMCQRCHLRYDQAHHQESRARRKPLPLFDAAPASAPTTPSTASGSRPGRSTRKPSSARTSAEPKTSTSETPGS